MLQRLPAWLLKPIAALAKRWDWLGRRLNSFAINQTVNVSRRRPHPWSTAHDYVSWTSLTDQNWSARHLPAAPQPAHLPDPADAAKFFLRPAGTVEWCDKSTLLFPAFAQYLTDGFIRTKMPKTGEPADLRKQNTSNHQIDMCPLYGRTPAQTKSLRLLDDTPGRRGRLKSQSIQGEEFAPFLFRGTAIDPDFAVLDEPLGLNNVQDPGARASLFAFGGDRVNASPQVALLNTLFLREHNRLAQELEKCEPAWDDERVFQTARNILIVMFIKIVVEEYINHIAPSPLRLRADPQVAWKAPWNKPNWITTEFSLLYRWHSLVPDTISWGGKPYAVADTSLDNRPFIANGVGRSFVELSNQRAARLGAFNTAPALLTVEEKAIRQGRTCDLAPYGAYREYVGLPAPASFDGISSDPRVGAFLRSRYQSPANIDFYVGLFAEDTVKNSPLPPLILRMVAVDAFSQALTNPLLSEHVFNERTFTPYGWQAIQDTASMSDVVRRNVPNGAGLGPIGMTQAGWTYRW